MEMPECGKLSDLEDSISKFPTFPQPLLLAFSVTNLNQDLTRSELASGSRGGVVCERIQRLKKGESGGSHERQKIQ